MTAFFESALFPNLLYLLLIAGIWLAVLAILSPGTGVLELLALLALTAAGLGTLELALNLWALIVMLVGVVLFGLSFWLRRLQLWLVLAAACLSLGSAFLFRAADPGPAVHPLLAVIVTMLTLAYFWLAVSSAVRAQRERPNLDPSKVLGAVGETRTPLDPTGSIYVAGELWTARSKDFIEQGEQVRVTEREGLMLNVVPLGKSDRS